MGRKSSSTPAATPTPVATAAPTETATMEPANRAAVTRADTHASKSKLMASDLGPADVDPLTQRKTLSGGSANLMG
jgi:hypothetical protein